MSIIKALENKTTAREKELFLNQLHDNLLSDLWLIYGRIGTAGREEKIAIIARCDKTRAEKIETVKRFLASAKHAKNLFSAIGDTKQLSIWKRTEKRIKAWKGDFENEKDK